MSRAWEIGVVWIAHYSIHSTLLLGITWLLTHFKVLRSYNVHDVLWKVAVVGSPISATVVTIMALPYVTPSRDVIFLAWAGGAALAVTWFGITYVRVRAFLRSTYPADAELQSLFDSLCAKAGVRHKITLLVSPALLSPVALLFRRICIPEYVVHTLPIAQQRAILAHELAHVLRGDASWLTLAGLLKAAFFLQPLNIIAYERLQETAEYLADHWVVQQVGRPLILAECIAQVAARLLNQSPVAPGLVATRSFLLGRVQHLVDPVEYPPVKRHAVVFVIVMGSLLCSGVLLAMFAVQVAYHIHLFMWLVVGGIAGLLYLVDHVELAVLKRYPVLCAIILECVLYGSVLLMVVANEERLERRVWQIACTVLPLLVWLIIARIAIWRRVVAARG